MGIDKIATVISNGDDAPGILLDNTSEEFREIFEKSDLIIAKGQGNFEGLVGCGKTSSIFQWLNATMWQIF